MATSIVDTLFGVSPERLQQQRAAEADARALQFAKLDPFQQATFAIGRGASGLAGAIGGALGGQDPELQRVTMRQQIAGQIDYTSEDSIRQGMAMLSDDPAAVQQLAQILRQQQESGALVGQRLREKAPPTTPQITNANAVALRAGPPGTPEYQAAFDASLDQQMIKPPGVVVQTGDIQSQFGPIGQGMERYIDTDGTVRERPVPGSAQDVARMQDADKKEGRKKQTAQAGGTVVQDLQRALNLVQKKSGVTGRSAAFTLALPEIARAETDAQSVNGFIQSALSNVGLDTLQTMRENSPTGGALGQVPIQQQMRLEQVLGSLDQTQKKEVVEDNLKRVINIYMDTIHGTQDEINQQFEDGDITKKEKETFGFRHKLSFDERGNPIGKPARGRSNAPVAPAGIDSLLEKYQ